MNILMLTNTYTPHVGGVARSVERFTCALRSRGHRVVVVAPEFEGRPEDEEDVVRVPALKQIEGGGFVVALPVPGYLELSLEDFEPDVVHAHHPFLLGSTALRYAARNDLPSVFTHHTRYERYLHYLADDSEALAPAARSLATGFANLCDGVVAPSASLQEELVEQGVEVPVAVIPTGIRPARFEEGSGGPTREALEVPRDAFVVGHVGRLAEEKNLGFLTRAVGEFLLRDHEAYFVVVGDGPATEDLRENARQFGVEDRLRLAGVRTGPDLVDAFHSFDVFAFSSTSETQGMVLAEAMAASVPVVGLDAAGTRDVVRDGRNGLLVESETIGAFADALRRIRSAPPRRFQDLRRGARETAEDLSMARTTDDLEALYEELVSASSHRARSFSDRIEDALTTEWHLWCNLGEAAASLLQPAAEDETQGA